MMNQFKNLSTVADESATASASAKRNSLGPRNPLATSSNIMNDDLVVHAQDDDTNITGADDGPSSSNNRTDLQQSDDSASSSRNNSPNTSQRNSLEDFRTAKNDNGGENKMNLSGGIQMQDMSPKTNETNTKLENTIAGVNKSPLHSFGSVGNSFARKVNLNQFLVGDDYQAPAPKYNDNSNNNWYNSAHKY